MAFAGVEEADKTNRRDKVLVSRVTLLQAAWGHAGAMLSRLAVITLSSDSHQRSSFSSLAPVTPDWVTGGLVIHQVEFLGLLLGFSQAKWMLLR